MWLSRCLELYRKVRAYRAFAIIFLRLLVRHGGSRLLSTSEIESVNFCQSRPEQRRFGKVMKGCCKLKD